MMVPLRMLPLVLRTAWRARTRTALTVLGVALATFVAGVVGAMREGARRATSVDGADVTLIVYRENRYCPFTSRLPQSYASRIAAIDGVASVIPVRLIVSTCQASLDVVTFHGVPDERIETALGAEHRLASGSIAAWHDRSDAAVLGEAVASRRGLEVGDRLRSAGIDVQVVGVLETDDPQDRNTAFVHLPFLQEVAQKGGTGGVVTRFDVRLAPGAAPDAVADAIDAEFAPDPDPTATSPEQAFVAQAAADVLAIVRFAGWLGIAALAAVLALVGNAIALATLDRAREHAVMQTIGFRPTLVARLVVTEAVLLATFGAIVGQVAAWFTVAGGRFSLTAEGVSIEAIAGPGTLAVIFATAIGLALVASLPPAWRASRTDPARVLREGG